MIILHVLSGVGILLLTGYHLVRPIVVSEERERLTEHFTATFVLFGGVWAIALFSGFFQLGSMGTVPRLILIKLGVTMAGGASGLITALGFIRGGWSLPVYLMGQSVTFLFFLSALYGGIQLY